VCCAVSLSADEGDAVVEEDVTQDDDAADITSQVNMDPGGIGAPNPLGRLQFGVQCGLQQGCTPLNVSTHC